MVSNSRYANLGEVPLKAMAQLRGLSPNGDKDSLVQRLVAQDIETGAVGETDNEAGEPNDETWDSDVKAAEITNGADDDEAWEGKKTSKRVAAKPEIRVSKDIEDLQDTSTAGDIEELEPIIEDKGDLQDAAPATEDVDPKVAEGTHDVSTADVLRSEADVPVGEVSKKKRRRGKKGGKKVNKNKATEGSDTAGGKAEKGSVEPEVAHDVDDAEAVGKASSTASTVVEDNDAVDSETSSGSIEPDMTQDVLDSENASGSVEPGVTLDVVADQGGYDAESAVELSSTAPTVVEEPSSGLEKTIQVEDEPAEDIQAPSSPEVKLRQITKKARTVRASPDQFDVLGVEEDNVAKLEAIESAIDLAMDPANDSAPKKSRKRGKKGGKKVQKAVAKKTQPKHFTHVACAAALFGVVGVAVGVSAMFA